MQFLSPAQLVLVLWLLAAAAPAATVLLNGSILPLGFYGTEEFAPQPTASRGTDATSTSAQRVTVLAEIWTRSAGADLDGDRIEGKLSDGQIAQPASVSSVLHTGVQRHRPKAA